MSRVYIQVFIGQYYYHISFCIICGIKCFIIALNELSKNLRKTRVQKLFATKVSIEEKRLLEDKLDKLEINSKSTRFSDVLDIVKTNIFTTQIHDEPLYLPDKDVITTSSNVSHDIE